MSEPQRVWRAWHSTPAALGREAPWFIAYGTVVEVNGTTMVLETDTGTMTSLVSKPWRRSRAAAIRDAAHAIDRAAKALARQAEELRALVEAAGDDTDGNACLGIGEGEPDDFAEWGRAAKDGTA